MGPLSVVRNEQIPEQAVAGHGGAAYSDELDSVVVSGDRVDYSQNGRLWSSIDVAVPDAFDTSNLTAAGTPIFVDNWGALILTPE